MSFNLETFLFESIGFLPEIFLVFCCVSELMITLFTTTAAPYPLEARPVARRVAFYFLVAILVMLFLPSYQNAAYTGFIFWAGAFQINLALVYTKVVLAILTIFVLLTAGPYLVNYRLNNYEFGVLVGLASIAMFCVISAYNLVVLYLALELQALLFFILLAWRRRSRWSLDATLKYLIVNLLASVFFLLAINRCYSAAGSASYVALANYCLPLLKAFVAHTDEAFLLVPEEFPILLRTFVGGFGLLQTGWWLGLMSLLIAFSLKLGVAPFHLWVPSIYANGVLPAVNLLATASKISYVAALSVLLGYVFYPVVAAWQWFFVVCALVSVVWGNMALLGQTNLLRILGLSSVASGGYLYLILGFAPSLYMYPLAVGYMILSSFLTAHWFLVLATVYTAQSASPIINYNTELGLRYISDLSTLRYASGHPAWYLTLALNVCSTAGIPPLVGFWTKFLTYTTVTAATGLNTLTVIYLIVIMLFTLVGASTYLRMLSALLFEEPSQIRSYLPAHWSFQIMNFMFFVFNVSLLFWSTWDYSLGFLTPYYYSATGFMWY